MRRALFNMDSKSEVVKGIMEAFRALSRGARNLVFRGKTINRRTNARGRGYVEITAALETKFRIYEPDEHGKSTVMAIVDDLYAKKGEIDGKTIYENPILWGRVQTNRGRENLFFFNDGTPREAIEEYKIGLVRTGVVEPAKIFTEEEVAKLKDRLEEDDG
jgi:hypothetical protein